MRRILVIIAACIVLMTSCTKDRSEVTPGPMEVTADHPATLPETPGSAGDVSAAAPAATPEKPATESETAAEPGAGKAQPFKLYYYQLDKIHEFGLDKTLDLMRTAAGLGYNAVVFHDPNFERLALKDEAFFNDLRRIRALADELNMEIVPCFGSLGYGTPFLKNDPNLAEGIRIEDAPFIVKNGKADAVLEPETACRGGDFEQFEGDVFPLLWKQDDPGTVTFADQKIKAAGQASIRLEAADSYKMARARFQTRVKPWRAYRVWYKVKTEDIKGGNGSFPRVEVEGNRLLSRQLPPIKPTQDWQTYCIFLNSWDNTEVSIEIGLWSWAVKGGTAWVDDVRIEAAGLLNVLRRPGCPVIVKDADGTVYEEGRDYARIEDPDLNPSETEHIPPAITIPADSRIKEGARLLVSSYAPLVNSSSQVAVCLSEPKVYEIMGSNLRRLKEIFNPKTYLCSLDEVRLANHCYACRSLNLPSGLLISEAARRIYATLKNVDPDAEMIIWNDIFDPHHNALREHYYYVPGTRSYDGSWERMPTGVIMGNWTRKTRKSQEFWAERGNRQILCGYYGNPDNIDDWMISTADLPGIVGAMFCNYNGKWSDLKPFADNVRKALAER